MSKIMITESGSDDYIKFEARGFLRAVVDSGARRRLRVTQGGELIAVVGEVDATDGVRGINDCAREGNDIVLTGLNRVILREVREGLNLAVVNNSVVIRGKLELVDKVFEDATLRIGF